MRAVYIGNTSRLIGTRLVEHYRCLGPGFSYKIRCSRITIGDRSCNTCRRYIYSSAQKKKRLHSRPSEQSISDNSNSPSRENRLKETIEVQQKEISNLCSEIANSKKSLGNLASSTLHNRSHDPLHTTIAQLNASLDEIKMNHTAPKADLDLLISNAVLKIKLESFQSPELRNQSQDSIHSSGKRKRSNCQDHLPMPTVRSGD